MVSGTASSLALLRMPDLTRRRHGPVVFVHGCFWYGCRQPDIARLRTLSLGMRNCKRSVERDRLVESELESIGWHLVCVWQQESVTVSEETPLGVRDARLDPTRKG